jgi:hypothetical protein
MRALDLEYRNEKIWWTRGGWVALFLVCAALGQMVWHYRSVVERNAAQQAQLDVLTERLQPRGIGRHPAKDLRLGADIRSAQEVLVRLDQPWDRLFAAVEAATGDDVALLGINPDPKKGLVRITGEAKHYQDVLAYARRLDASCCLSGAYLQSHQVQTHDPEQPVRFTLGAVWEDGS